MATYYVSTTGSDAAAGSLAAPWRTVQKAANTAAAGDTVNVRGGVYAERVTVTVSGSPGAGYTTFQSYTGETAVLDGTTVPFGGDEGMILIEDESYLRIMGFEIRNYKTSSSSQLPVGIFVQGGSHHIELRGNYVHHIENNGGANGNAHGIAVYGTSAAQAITDIIVDDNEIANCKLGSSESMVLNGNVTNFEVTNNYVHDNDNIGIDFIGFEDVCPTESLDQARNGVCRGNLVVDIDSITNPAYDGGRSADGIYVDGGRDIIIERNIVIRANIGIEMASEHSGKATSFITVRNNVVIGSHTYGIAIGGYDTNRGSTSNCKILNNTLYNNGTDEGGADIEVQFDTRDNVFKNNVIYGNGLGYFIHNDYTQNTGNVVDYNLYFSSSAPTAASFLWKTVEYEGWASWQASSGNDVHSLWANPQFVNAAGNDLHVLASSPVLGRGENTAGVGSLDLDGAARIQGTGIEIGAYEIPASGGAPAPVFISEAVALSEALASFGTGTPAPPPDPPPPPPPPPPSLPPPTPPPAYLPPPPSQPSVSFTFPNASSFIFPIEAVAGPRVTHYHHLGAGVVRPFVRASHGDLGSSQGADTVLSAIGQVFGTRKGTLPWRPEFGSQLEGLRHRANTPVLRELAGEYVRQALRLWEPRVQLRRLVVDLPRSVTESNQVVVHTAVAIEGEPGEHKVSTAFGRVSDRPTVEVPLGYLTSTLARTPHGLGPLVPPPALTAPPTTTFGGGIVRPFYRVQDVNNGTGVKEILSNVGQVLGTTPGTLPWLPEFGCELHRLRHKANTAGLRELARLYVERALTRWEPRSQVSEVEILSSKTVSDNVITVRVLCRITLLQEGPNYLFDVAVK